VNRRYPTTAEDRSCPIHGTLCGRRDAHEYQPGSVGLFFDLDGTLADSERLHWTAWRAALKPREFDLSWELYQRHAVGHPDPVFADWLIERIPGCRRGAKDVLLHDKGKRFVSLAAESSPISPATREIVMQASRRFPLALVTSSPRVEVEAVLGPIRLMDSFRAVVCLDDVQKPKPDPEPYRLARSLLMGATGVAFEDSAAGETSARSAGLSVIRVRGPSDIVCEVAGFAPPPLGAEQVARRPVFGGQPPSDRRETG
jgi:HAD superfamily hydrolase (TIGR01509 family)